MADDPNQWPDTPVQDAWPDKPVDRSVGQQVVDMGKAAGSGLLHEGAAGLFGMPIDLANTLTSGSDYLAEKITGEKPKTKDLPGGSQDIKAGISKVIPEYEPQNTAERYMKTTAGFLPMVAAAPEAWALRTLPAAALRYGIAPGLASEGGGDAAAKVAGEEWRPAGQVAGALLGPSIARPMLTPNPALRSGQEELVNALKKENVTGVTAGQAAGDADTISREAKYASAPWSGTSSSAINEKQAEQVTQAALKHAGIDATSADPKTLARMAAANDAEFTRLTGQHTMPVNQNVTQAMDNAITKYESSNVAVSDKPRQIFDDIVDLATNKSPTGVAGTLDGRTYQNIRSTLGNMAADAPSAGEARTYKAMQDALDAGMESTIQASAPKDVGAFKQVRDEYHNQLIVKKAASMAGPEASRGMLSPENLSSAVRAIDGSEELAMQSRPITKLARAGEAVLQKLPSGEGQQEYKLAATLAALGAGGGEYAKTTNTDDNAKGNNGLLHALGGGLLGAAVGARAPGVAGRLMFNTPGVSPAIQAWRANQAALPKALSSDEARKLLTVRALLNGGQRQPSEPVP